MKIKLLLISLLFLSCISSIFSIEKAYAIITKSTSIHNTPNGTPQNNIIFNNNEIVLVKDFQEIKIKSEVFTWILVEKNNDVGWIRSDFLIEFPVEGVTAIKGNPNVWKIFKTTKLNEVIDKFHPLEEIQLLEHFKTDDNILFKIKYNESIGWIFSELFNPSLNQDSTLKSFYLYGNNNNYEILNDASFGINELKIGSTVDFLEYKIGSPTKKTDNYYEYHYFTHVLANPAFILTFDISNKKIIKITGDYIRGD